MPREVERQHVAEITAMQGCFFVDVSAEHLCFFVERSGTKRMLGIEGKRDVLHAIGRGEIPSCRLMPPMLALHEVPPVIHISRQRPFSEIGFHAGTSVEGRVGVSIIVGEIEKTIDSTVNCGGEMFGYGFPTVVALDIEETALIALVCLGLIEMIVLSGVLLHVAIGIQPPVALQLGHQSRSGIGKA